ncbi:MAG: ribosomal protein S18-alanine N-acetyltransferase [Frankiaceae bacterium]|nr:ribosomal protein S18-alanine N-acetyltransferase [Frankiaceae bacterium]MBV9368546.1 ribosomal protein S18-alanine N-acetyltransferase [Frankiales bacterium]
MTVELRPMQWDDIDAVMRMEAELFGNESWTETMFWSELSQRETRHYVVAVDSDDDAVIGYAGLCAYAPHEAYVQTIGVTKPRQGEGIGTRMLFDLIAEAEKRGCPRLDLEVRADNATAIALYERHGFHRIGVRRGYYQPSGTDAVVMRRERTTQ